MNAEHRILAATKKRPVAGDDPVILHILENLGGKYRYDDYYNEGKHRVLVFVPKIFDKHSSLLPRVHCRLTPTGRIKDIIVVGYTLFSESYKPNENWRVVVNDLCNEILTGV